MLDKLGVSRPGSARRTVGAPSGRCRNAMSGWRCGAAFAPAAATWIAHLPATLRAGPEAWREWAGARKRKRIGALGAHEGCAWEIAAHLESCGGVSHRTALAAIVSADLRAQGVSEITKEAVDQCLTAAMHAGLLDNDGGAWRIPIPSFQAHLCHKPPPDRGAEVAALPSPAGEDPSPLEAR